MGMDRVSGVAVAPLQPAFVVPAGGPVIAVPGIIPRVSSVKMAISVAMIAATVFFFLNGSSEHAQNPSWDLLDFV